MTENEIFTKITTIIEDHFDVSADKVTEQTTLRQILMPIRSIWWSLFWN